MAFQANATEKNSVDITVSIPESVKVGQVCYIQNDVVRTLEEHYDGALESISTYRENGIVEKCDTYYEGKISNTINYDENGNEIEN